MIKVKFHAPWMQDEKAFNWIQKYTEDNIDSWKEIKLVKDNDYDFIAVFNYPNDQLKANKKKMIIFQGEPDPIRVSWNEYYIPDKSKFFYVFDTLTHFNSVGWTMKDSYVDFQNKDIIKTKIMSGVISNKQFFPGQQARLKFAKELAFRFPWYDHFGRNTGKPTEDKSDALYPYAYTFNAENVCEKNYFTEKITDAIMSECLCFYWGCPNIEQFYDKDAFIKINIFNVNEAIDIIVNCIQNNEREKRLDAIKRVKHRIMNEYQPLALVRNILKQKGII